MKKVNLADAGWFKSSYSNGQSACVEVAFHGEGAVQCRDSKVQAGPVLQFSEASWQAFVSTVVGELDA
ncbi:DUF397 domain-containing protein [Streptomyces malaysiensis]|uniref:DUF397 domain-containing protein n=1 Tax=Streptomyces malaysiensis TaxID=92644 RepID=UPI00142EE8D9|nr:DUF397 domain-containing protein [Streptomyces malaysiensis]